MSLPAASAGATPVPLTLGSSNGFAPMLLVPLPVSATNTTMTFTIANTAPANAPTLAHGRFVQQVRRALGAGNSTALLYVSLYFTNTLTLPSSPSLTLTVPAADVVNGAAYYLALYDPTRPSLGWELDFEGPATVNGSTLTFAANPAAFTFQGGLFYYFAIIAVPQSGAQPTPAPAISPTTVPTQPPPTLPQAAVGADSFVDSVGLNTHLSQNNEKYVTAYPQVRSLLVGLGVRHIRDGLVSPADPSYFQHLNDLGTAGIHSDIVTAVGESPSLIASYPANISQSIEMLEGPNEYDLSNDPNWPANVAAFQTSLFNTAAGNFPVIGPSFVTEQAYGAAGNLFSVANFGNIRYYLAGRNPGTRGYGATDSFGVYGSLSYQLAIARQSTGQRPIVATEAGYDDVLGPKVPNAIPADVKARYTMRMLLEAYRAGMPRVYLYELLDEDTSLPFGSSGLVDASLNPKPAYTAVKNLIAALADPGTPVTTTPLNFGITADSSVHRLLFQKRDGSYALVLWEEVQSFDPDKQTPIAVTPQSVTLAFPAALRAIGAATFDDTGTPAASSVATLSTSVFGLTVSDRVTIVTVRP